jgi:pimeloyl-ACP methyl ester carboxylesterase
MDTLSLHVEAADIAAVIQSLAGGRAIVLGHAHGNGVARTVATEYPTLVRQVILLAAGGMVPRAPDIEQAFQRVLDPSPSRQEPLAAIQKSFFSKDNNAALWQDGWYFDVAAEQMAGAGANKVAGILAGRLGDDPRSAGARRRYRRTGRLAAEFPNRVTVVEIPNSGHAMLPEQPELIASAILAHLRR